MKSSYKFYTDAGHGWLAVPIKDLKELGIENSITLYSYMRGKTAYLEEDCDAGAFMEAYEKMNGKRPEISYGKHQDRSPIRSYDGYTSL
jgi:hypothetical protein